MRPLLTALTLGLSALTLTAGLISSPALAETTVERIGKPLNHPWGMDFIDDDTMLVTERRGRMFKIDLQSGDRDEINIVEASQNYGWPLVSHGEKYAGGKIGIGTSDPQFKDPAWTWIPSIAPSGMAFYQGNMFPEYSGHVLVGSLKFQSLYLVKLENNQPTSERVILVSDRKLIE